MHITCARSVGKYRSDGVHRDADIKGVLRGQGTSARMSIGGPIFNFLNVSAIARCLNEKHETMVEH